MIAPAASRGLPNHLFRHARVNPMLVPADPNEISQCDAPHDSSLGPRHGVRPLTRSSALPPKQARTVILPSQENATR
jgi:hypothetical protein